MTTTTKPALVAVDIKVDRVYSAKRPAAVGLFPTQYNDRVVLWMDPARTRVQYDSPTVKSGRHYPKVTMEKFLAWADEDVTALCPNGEWRDYPARKA